MWVKMTPAGTFRYITAYKLNQNICFMKLPLACSTTEVRKNQKFRVSIAITLAAIHQKLGLTSQNDPYGTSSVKKTK